MAFLYNLRVSADFTQCVICVTAFTGMLIYGLIVPVLPFALSERIGLPDNEVQKWNSIMFGAYGVAITLGSIFFGYIGDLTSTRKAPFVAGLILLAISTLLFAFARSLEVLVLARICQGLSSSISATIGNALLLDKVGPANIGRACGWTGLSSSLGFFAGPVIGGVLYQFAGWFAVFIPAFVLIAIEILLRLMVIEEDRSFPMETVGRRSETTPLLLNEEEIVQTVVTGPQINNSDRGTDVQKRHVGQESIKTITSPRLKLLTSSRLLIAMENMLVLNGLAGAMESVLPLYCHELFGFNPSEAALVFIPLTAPCFFSPAAGILIDRMGSKRPLSAAFLLVTVSFVMLGFVVHPSLSNKVMMLVGLVCQGFIITFAYPAILKDVVLAVDDFTRRHPTAFGPQGAYSFAIGCNHAMDSLGVVLGSMYGGLIRELAGWQAMCLFMAAQGFVTLLLVLMSTREPLVEQRENEDLGA